ncbi:histone-lysine N-methyltransferase SETMAR [Trichonephila clavipes]|uniref:Histone-lysine N-methyltransferase SETMAR n=1 Tax=Trichonephila clavipes TaxID=2585209 RepID=A0A8X6V3F5_TRICX|nr:histone-lysine N-methyltransferase SETMAR [Trichonephila clavipes]
MASEERYLGIVERLTKLKRKIRANWALEAYNPMRNSLVAHPPRNVREGFREGGGQGRFEHTKIAGGGGDRTILKRQKEEEGERSRQTSDAEKAGTLIDPPEEYRIDSSGSCTTYHGFESNRFGLFSSGAARVGGFILKGVDGSVDGRLQRQRTFWRMPKEKKREDNPIKEISFGERIHCCQVIYSQFGLAIHQNDHQARRRFVEWAQNEIAVVPDFHKRILFSDEAHFWLNGYVNKQNCRIWSDANPQVYVETPLHPEKLTELWFQQDGATCHTARATIDLLKDTFSDRLISRFGPVNWPPRSCDLTPLDYFLWGYVKSLVYADKPQTLDHLEDNICRVIADIRPQMLEKVIENWTSRLDYIRASRGSPIPEFIFKM